MSFAIHHFGKPKQKKNVYLFKYNKIIFFFFLAGRVVYQADGFLDKNKNFLPAEVINLVRQSQFDM